MWIYNKQVEVAREWEIIKRYNNDDNCGCLDTLSAVGGTSFFNKLVDFFSSSLLFMLQLFPFLLFVFFLFCFIIIFWFLSVPFFSVSCCWLCYLKWDGNTRNKYLFLGINTFFVCDDFWWLFFLVQLTLFLACDNFIALTCLREMELNVFCFVCSF